MPLLVVIPAYAGDYNYALANLQRQQPCGHSALLVLDSGLSKEQRKSLRDEAEKSFAHTTILAANLVSAFKGWPAAPNYVWQFTVRYIESEVIHWAKRKLNGWLWWEADAAPLTPDWLDTLDAAYVKCGKPIMGHIVPQRGHMNGVAIYPFDMSRYAYKAMLTRATPFDVALSSECKSRIAPANELIAHVLKRNGGDPPRPLNGSTHLPSTCVLVHGYCHSTPADTKRLKQQQQEHAMNETSKAMRRRRCEEAEGGFGWNEILTGNGIDVGAGGDPVQLPKCKAFDMHDGDANHLSRYISKSTLDYVHASQCLEHMHEPTAALLDWAICVRPGGHLVVTVPDFDLYEHCQWPSRFNPDHKSAWSMWRKSAPGVPLIYVPAWCRDLKQHGLACLKVELCDARYDYGMLGDVDQTLSPDGAEAFIELVFRKEQT
jgi:SAM-dependent methyltransferase